MEWLAKALDLLKAGGWQLLMIAVAAAVFLLLDRHGILPGVNDTWRLFAWALMLACAFLALAPVLSFVQQSCQKRINNWETDNRRKKAITAAERRFRDYLPYLSDRERAIFGYLLKHKKKHFTADMDAGYAAGLMAMGFVVRIGVAGQAFDIDKVPMGVPDHIWSILEANPEQFDYQPENAKGHAEVEPWRIPWMAR